MGDKSPKDAKKKKAAAQKAAKNAPRPPAKPTR